GDHSVRASRDTGADNRGLLVVDGLGEARLEGPALQPLLTKGLRHGMRHPCIHDDAGHQPSLEAVLSSEAVLVDLVLGRLLRGGRAHVKLRQDGPRGETVEAHGLFTFPVAGSRLQFEILLPSGVATEPNSTCFVDPSASTTNNG